MKTIKVRRRHLLLLLLLIAGIGLGIRSLRSDAQADTRSSALDKQWEQISEYAVYCWTTMEITLPTHRLVTQLPHPPGGPSAINESLENLDHQDIPKPLPDEMKITTQKTQCTDSWSDVFDLANMRSLGGASALLDRDEPFDPTNMRQAALRVLHKGSFEAADAMFPPARRPLLSE